MTDVLISAGPVCRHNNGSVTGYVYGYLLEMPVFQCDCSSELVFMFDSK